MKVRNHKLKIAFIHPDLGIGGAERLVLDVAGALASQGHKVEFITNHFDVSHAFDELKSGQYPVQVYGDWIPRGLFGRFQALSAYIRMVYLSIVYLLFYRKKNPPDLYFTDLIPIANPLLKFAGEKVIYYCHHPDLLASAPGGALKRLYRKPINWLEMKATKKADLILVNSEYTASVFRDTFPEIKKAIHILYPTVAHSYQKTVEKLKSIKPIEEIVPEIKSKSRNKTIFLSLNRFHPAKKLELAVLAMDHLKKLVSNEKWNNTYFIMAGGYDPQSVVNSQTYSTLVDLTKEMNLQDKIIFLKSPSDLVKAQLLLSCTCLLYTPVKEHFGIVPLEAMTVSKPVIAVNSGGPRETVDHGVTGYLCESNAESMAEFMCRIIENETVQMGIQGKKRLDEKFSYTSFKNQLEQIVGDVGYSAKKIK